MIKYRGLEDTLHQEMADPVSGLGGFNIVDLSDGSEVLGYDQGRPRVMASTTKLFTAGAALSSLGASATASTRLFADSLPSGDGVLAGDLYVVGGGDPTLGDAEHVEATFGGKGTRVDRLVEQVRAAGIGCIQGRVIGDGSLFESEGGFSSRVTALTYNNSRHEQPVLYAAEMITDALRSRGVSVSQPAAEGVADLSVKHPVGSVESPSVLSLLTLAGHNSDNHVAESISKLIAGNEVARGSTNAGAAAIQSHAKTLGADINIINGSGLGASNRCTPSAVTTFLASVYQSQHRSDFIQTLPQAGAEGTLRLRMRNTLASETVQAKTGTLTRQKKPFQDSLAGYVFGRSRTVAFSIVREKTESRAAARSSIDRMVDALAHYCD